MFNMCKKAVRQTGNLLHRTIREKITEKELNRKIPHVCPNFMSYILNYF